MTNRAIHVVAAIIWHPIEPNTILISQRLAGKHLEGYWELPGGKKEMNEARENTLVRELREELDITAEEYSPFMQVSHDYEDRSIYLDVWHVTQFSSTVKSKEGQDLKWVSISDLEVYQFPDADKPVLDAIKSSVRERS